MIFLLHILCINHKKDFLEEKNKSASVINISDRSPRNNLRTQSRDLNEQKKSDKSDYVTRYRNLAPKIEEPEQEPGEGRRRATAYIDDCEYLSKVTIVIWLLCINFVATGRVQWGQIEIKSVSGGTGPLTSFQCYFKSWVENWIVTIGRATEILTYSGPQKKGKAAKDWFLPEFLQ